MYVDPLDNPIVEIDIQTVDPKGKVRDHKILIGKPALNKGAYWCHTKIKGHHIQTGLAISMNQLQSLCRGLSTVKQAIHQYIEIHKMELIFEGEKMELADFEKMFEIS